MLAVGAAAVVMELGNGKVMAQPDFDRKVEPVTQNAPQPVPDNTPTAEWPGLGATPQSMPEAPAPVVDDRPAGINIPAAEPPAPEIRVGEEEDVPYDYEDARKTCDDEHYDICNDLLGECEDAGYGKQELDYETKLDLAVGATEVEMSKLLGEEMLPALDGVGRRLPAWKACWQITAGKIRTIRLSGPKSTATSKTSTSRPERPPERR